MIIDKTIAWISGTLNIPLFHLEEKYRRHYIRGLFESNGTFKYRQNRDIVVLRYKHINKYLVELFQSYISDSLLIESKELRYNDKKDVWKISWSGLFPQFLLWWMYHGDIKDICSAEYLRKYQKILNNVLFTNSDRELIYSVNAYIKDNEIHFMVPSTQTLLWAHRLQKLLSFNTVPVYHNKGVKKYYRLYISDKSIAANMRDIRVIPDSIKA